MSGKYSLKNLLLETEYTDSAQSQIKNAEKYWAGASRGIGGAVAQVQTKYAFLELAKITGAMITDISLAGTGESSTPDVFIKGKNSEGNSFAGAHSGSGYAIEVKGSGSATIDLNYKLQLSLADVLKREDALCIFDEQDENFRMVIFNKGLHEDFIKGTLFEPYVPYMSSDAFCNIKAIKDRKPTSRRNPDRLEITVTYAMMAAAAAKSVSYSGLKDNVAQAGLELKIAKPRIQAIMSTIYSPTQVTRQSFLEKETGIFPIEASNGKQYTLQQLMLHFDHKGNSAVPLMGVKDKNRTYPVLDKIDGGQNDLSSQSKRSTALTVIDSYLHLSTSFHKHMVQIYGLPTEKFNHWSESESRGKTGIETPTWPELEKKLKSMFSWTKIEKKQGGFKFKYTTDSEKDWYQINYDLLGKPLNKPYKVSREDIIGKPKKKAPAALKEKYERGQLYNSIVKGAKRTVKLWDDIRRRAVRIESTLTSLIAWLKSPLGAPASIARIIAGTHNPVDSEGIFLQSLPKPSKENLEAPIEVAAQDLKQVVVKGSDETTDISVNPAVVQEESIARTYSLLGRLEVLGE